MAITYGKIESEVSNILGNIVGSTMSDADTNYAATASTSNRLNPDFSPTAVQDAILAVMSEIAYTIFVTPRHPERANFVSFSTSLTNGAPIPTTDAGGSNLVVGIPGIVRDASTAIVCTPMDLDQIAAYNRFKTTIYTGYELYHYALNGDRIYHTRTSVTVEWPTWVRPTWTAGNNILFLDYHETGIVMGAVARLALAEGAYAAMAQQAAQYYTSHLERIRSIADPMLMTTAEAAPSQT